MHVYYCLSEFGRNMDSKYVWTFISIVAGYHFCGYRPQHSCVHVYLMATHADTVLLSCSSAALRLSSTGQTGYYHVCWYKPQSGKRSIRWWENAVCVCTRARVCGGPRPCCNTSFGTQLVCLLRSEKSCELQTIVSLKSKSSVQT